MNTLFSQLLIRKVHIRTKVLLYFLLPILLFGNLILCYYLQIISIEESSVLMTPTKVEIKLKKKEAGSWSKLEFPRPEVSVGNNGDKQQPQSVSSITSKVESVDLSCI